jgi:hypothetical protein
VFFKLTAQATASPWQGMDQARFCVSTSSPSLSAASTANNTPEKVTDKSPSPVPLEDRQEMTSPGKELQRQRLIYLMQRLKLLLQVLSVSVCDVTTVVLNEEAWILLLLIVTQCTSASFRRQRLSGPVHIVVGGALLSAPLAATDCVPAI